MSRSVVQQSFATMVARVLFLVLLTCLSSIMILGLKPRMPTKSDLIFGGCILVAFVVFAVAVRRMEKTTHATLWGHSTFIEKLLWLLIPAGAFAVNYFSSHRDLGADIIVGCLVVLIFLGTSFWSSAKSPE